MQGVNKATSKVGRAHVDLERQTLVVEADEDIHVALQCMHRAETTLLVVLDCGVFAKDT